MVDTTYIYALCHPGTNEVRYVGKTTCLKKRLQSHIDYARSKNKQRPVSDWINSLIKKGLKPVIVELEICASDIWAEREMFWIKKYKSNSARLLNLTDGGESNNGYIYTPELLEVRRKARIGWKFPENVKSAIAASLSKKVVCIDDNIFYPSMKDAIKASGVPKSTFHRKLHNGEKINNKLYEFSNH